MSWVQHLWLWLVVCLRRRYSTLHFSHLHRLWEYMLAWCQARRYDSVLMLLLMVAATKLHKPACDTLESGPERREWSSVTNQSEPRNASQLAQLRARERKIRGKGDGKHAPHKQPLTAIQLRVNYGLWDNEIIKIYGWFWGRLGRKTIRRKVCFPGRVTRCDFLQIKRWNCFFVYWFKYRWKIKHGKKTS